MYGTTEAPIADAYRVTMGDVRREQRRQAHIDHTVRVLRILLADGGHAQVRALWSDGKTAPVAAELISWCEETGPADGRLRTGAAMFSPAIRDDLVSEFLTAYAERLAGLERSQWEHA
jgi:hypothetical protein